MGRLLFILFLFYLNENVIYFNNLVKIAKEELNTNNNKNSESSAFFTSQAKVFNSLSNQVSVETACKVFLIQLAHFVGIPEEENPSKKMRIGIIVISLYVLTCTDTIRNYRTDKAEIILEYDNNKNLNVLLHSEEVRILKEKVCNKFNYPNLSLRDLLLPAAPAMFQYLINIKTPSKYWVTSLSKTYGHLVKSSTPKSVAMALFTNLSKLEELFPDLALVLKQDAEKKRIESLVRQECRTEVRRFLKFYFKNIAKGQRYFNNESP
jgi:hypothetical protein